MAEQKPKPKKAKAPNFFKSTFFKISVLVVLFFFIAASGGVLYYYNYYSRIIDRKLGGEVFKNTAEIYAAPYRIYTGQKLSADDVVGRLQRAGFDTTEKGGSEDGAYEIDGTKLIIRPKAGDEMRLEFQKNALRKIVKLAGDETSEAWLPAELVTNLFDETRQKRRIVEFNELPKNLVGALIASEDQRFYSHWGIDPVRLVGAMLQSVRASDRMRGTSTITQQLARTFFLNPDRSIKR